VRSTLTIHGAQIDNWVYTIPQDDSSWTRALPGPDATVTDEGVMLTAEDLLAGGSVTFAVEGATDVIDAVGAARRTGPAPGTVRLGR